MRKNREPARFTQSDQIMQTTDAVTDMTRSILQVSSNASQASQVAQRSLQAATQGSLAVQNTIAGMNGIREQIQETSKRIAPYIQYGRVRDRP